MVELEPGWVAVNGVKFLNSQTAARDSAGRPLTHVPSGTRRVGAGEVWLFGFNDARSWDARYFGSVPAAERARRAAASGDVVKRVMNETHTGSRACGSITWSISAG